MSYDDIKQYLYGIEDFKKLNAITYHKGDPEGFYDKIIKFLKTKDVVLKKRFESLSKEKKETHSKLKLLERDNLDLNCPVCGYSNDVASTYCRTCGFKFFDKF